MSKPTAASALSRGNSAPFSLLVQLFGDSEMMRIFSEGRSLDLWIDVEVALAHAQAELGVISQEAGYQIQAAADIAREDARLIWEPATNVGYPILPLVRLIDSHAGTAGSGHVHLGATTQDIMDTALAIQLRDATDLLLEHLQHLGNSLAAQTSAHRRTVMAGRTHAQQAVPITLGMKLAVFLDQVRRARERLQAERGRVAVLSMFGAAGTSAAFGDGSPRLRDALGEQLGLNVVEVPWHVARDGIFAQCSNAVGAAETVARLAREIIDLSRTEIGEVLEPAGMHRGASSTMPQKANPILSEAIVGFAVASSSLMAGLGRAMEAGHERSAGEWQAEWHIVPQMMVLASSALLRASELVDGMVVNEKALARNLDADHGLLMAEAYMMALAPVMGRERAHDAIYAACLRTRVEDVALIEVLGQELAPEHLDLLSEVQPSNYVGQSESICATAVSSWTFHLAAPNASNPERTAPIAKARKTTNGASQ